MGGYRDNSSSDEDKRRRRGYCYNTNIYGVGNPAYGYPQQPVYNYGARRHSGSSDSDHSDHQRGYSRYRNQGGYGANYRHYSGDRHSSSDEGKRSRRFY
uniref:Uncharacterized protein n=1 Tax=Trichobilharzia regenti TaxID=157069 RepID=A0AA85JG85_TRIRE|nr:unnamed protein product [Trichobilharzia regenti]